MKKKKEKIVEIPVPDEQAVGKLAESEITFSQLIDLDDDKFDSLIQEQNVGYLKSLDNLLFSYYRVLMDAREKILEKGEDITEDEKHQLNLFYAGISKLNSKSYILKQRIKKLLEKPLQH